MKLLATRAQPWVAALSTVTLWASAFPLIKLALHDLAPIPLASLRFALAACLLWLCSWQASRRQGGRTEGCAASRLELGSAIPRLALAALLGIACYNGLLNTG